MMHDPITKREVRDETTQSAGLLRGFVPHKLSVQAVGPLSADLLFPIMKDRSKLIRVGSPRQDAGGSNIE